MINMGRGSDPIGTAIAFIVLLIIIYFLFFVFWPQFCHGLIQAGGHSIPFCPS